MGKGKSDLSNKKFVTFLNINLRALSKSCPHSELFLCVFSCILTDNGEILRISPYFVRMWENTDQNNSDMDTF